MRTESYLLCYITNQCYVMPLMSEDCQALSKYLVISEPNTYLQSDLLKAAGLWQSQQSNYKAYKTLRPFPLDWERLVLQYSLPMCEKNIHCLMNYHGHWTVSNQSFCYEISIHFVQGLHTRCIRCLSLNKTEMSMDATIEIWESDPSDWLKNKLLTESQLESY